MTTYLAIIIEGDNENTLGGACSRDVWHITNKLLRDIPIKMTDIHIFFRSYITDIYAHKLMQMGIKNIQTNLIDNIKRCFDECVEKSKQGETVIFYHYSGHGYQILDKEDDEVDGYDEIFLGRTMKDDFIWDNFVKRLSNKTRLISFVDACHSGSGMDMPYKWQNDKFVLSKKKCIEAECEGISFSACNDSQCASQDIGETTGFSGSLTAGICDLCNLMEMIKDPLKCYDILVTRLQKLNQNVEMYSVQARKIDDLPKDKK